MGIIELPLWRLSVHGRDRAGLRKGITTTVPNGHLVKDNRLTMFCDRCAAPIEFGAVMNRAGTYCSIECSLGGSVG